VSFLEEEALGVASAAAERRGGKKVVQHGRGQLFLILDNG